MTREREKPQVLLERLAVLNEGCGASLSTRALVAPSQVRPRSPRGCAVCVHACMLRGTFLDHSLGLLGLLAPSWAIVSRRAAVHEPRTPKQAPPRARAPSLLLLSPHLSSAWGLPTRTCGREEREAEDEGRRGRASWSGLGPSHGLPSIPRLCPKVTPRGRPLREAGLLPLHRFCSPSVVLLDPRISGTCARAGVCWMGRGRPQRTIVSLLLASSFVFNFSGTVSEQLQNLEVWVQTE